MLDVNRSQRGARLAAAAVALLACTAFADTTLWLVRPLYPGQETLVEKTEHGLDRLLTGDARKDSLIGQKELVRALASRKGDEVPCLSGDARCADPIDPFVASLGFDHVMLVMGGQDESGFKFKVVAYEPKTGKSTPATASNPVLEKALLGAVVKVFPATSTLEVKSSPAGATVFVDDQKMGVTPLSTQVLPGEHTVRLDLKLHQGVEEALFIPIRGNASLDKVLEKVAARLVVTAAPAGASISVDGQVLGHDRVDRGVAPGEHTLRLTLDGHKAFEQTFTVKAEEQFNLDKTLERIGGPPEPQVKTIVIRETVQAPDPKTGTTTTTPPPGPGPTAGTPTVATPANPPTPKVVPPPPPPPDQTELTYDKKSYFQFGFQSATLLDSALVGRRWGTAGTGRTERLTTPGRQLLGGEAEYGAFGTTFGLSVIGITYLTNADHAAMSVGFQRGASAEVINGVIGPDSIDPVKIHLIQLRALQPQVRVCFWKIMLSLQAGFEFRTGQIVETSASAFYKDGFMPVDLLVSARAALRVLLFEGFFLYGSGNYAFYLTGESTNNEVRSASAWGYNAGFGYGF